MVHSAQRVKLLWPEILAHLDASIELDFPFLASSLPETLFQLLCIHSLPLRKDRQRKR